MMVYYTLTLSLFLCYINASMNKQKEIDIPDSERKEGQYDGSKAKKRSLQVYFAFVAHSPPSLLEPSDTTADQNLDQKLVKIPESKTQPTSEEHNCHLEAASQSSRPVICCVDVFSAKNGVLYSDEKLESRFGIKPSSLLSGVCFSSIFSELWSKEAASVYEATLHLKTEVPLFKENTTIFDPTVDDFIQHTIHLYLQLAKNLPLDFSKFIYDEVLMKKLDTSISEGKAADSGLPLDLHQLLYYQKDRVMKLLSEYIDMSKYSENVKQLCKVAKTWSTLFNKDEHVTNILSSSFDESDLLLDSKDIPSLPSLLTKYTRCFVACVEWQSGDASESNIGEGNNKKETAGFSREFVMAYPSLFVDVADRFCSKCHTVIQNLRTLDTIRSYFITSYNNITWSIMLNRLFDGIKSNPPPEKQYIHLINLISMDVSAYSTKTSRAPTRFGGLPGYILEDRTCRQVVAGENGLMGISHSDLFQTLFHLAGDSIKAVVAIIANTSKHPALTKEGRDRLILKEEIALLKYLLSTLSELLIHAAFLDMINVTLGITGQKESYRVKPREQSLKSQKLFKLMANLCTLATALKLPPREEKRIPEKLSNLLELYDLSLSAIQMNIDLIYMVTKESPQLSEDPLICHFNSNRNIINHIFCTAKSNWKHALNAYNLAEVVKLLKKYTSDTADLEVALQLLNLE